MYVWYVPLLLPPYYFHPDFNGCSRSVFFRSRLRISPISPFLLTASEQALKGRFKKPIFRPDFNGVYGCGFFRSRLRFSGYRTKLKLVNPILFLSQWVNSKLKVPIHEHSKNNLNASSKRRTISVAYFLFIHYLIWSVMVSNANLGFHFSDAIKFQLGCSDKYDILSGQNAKIRKKLVTENRTTRPNIKWVRIIPC